MVWRGPVESPRISSALMMYRRRFPASRILVGLAAAMLPLQPVVGASCGCAKSRHDDVVMAQGHPGQPATCCCCPCCRKAGIGICTCGATNSTARKSCGRQQLGPARQAAAQRGCSCYTGDRPSEPSQVPPTSRGSEVDQAAQPLAVGCTSLSPDLLSALGSRLSSVGTPVRLLSAPQRCVVLGRLVL